MLGTYASIALLVNLRGSSAKAAALAAAPAPTAPDYHTPAPAATGIPDFGTKEWENFIQSNPKGFEIWLTGESK